MNKTILLPILMCLVACSAETMLEDSKPELAIVVSVASYGQDINGVSTRASINNGVSTSFAVGDDLGLFVVDKDGELIADNIRYVIQKTGLAYRVDASGKVTASNVYYDDDCKYFAYAPYSSIYDGCKSADDITRKYKEVYAHH